MRFSTIHKVTSYLMILSAVASLLLSPDISLTATIIALLGIALSFFIEPDRFPVAKLTATWNIATLLFLSYLVTSVLRGESVITAGVHFLLFVLVNKLCNRRSSKDYQQAYIVSFLMLVAATTLNSSLSYAVCFVLYVLFTTWTLILFHLRREMEENYLLKHSDGAESQKVEVDRILRSRRIIGGRFLAGTSLLSLGILLGAGALFVFFPRIGFGLFVGHRRTGVTMVGFREEVQLGQHGTLRDNPQIVMRIRFPSRKEPPQHKLYWRGSVFDHYQDGGWSHSPDIRGLTLPLATQAGLSVVNHAPGLPSRISPAEIRSRLLRQEIYLEPLDSTLLFAADRPVAVEIPRPKIGHRPLLVARRGPLGEIRGDRMRTSGVHYFAYSQVKRPSAAVLRQAPPLLDPRWSRFLQWPRNLPPRIRRLARRLTANERTTYDKVMAVQRYLKTRYRYSLELKHVDGLDPIDAFLFVTRSGHCEYFATALALLLRAAGVHARNVNGFAGGAWNRYGGYLAVRQGDAHAWTEVLFAGVGWVAFDATPAGGAPRGSYSPGVVDRIRQMLDALRLRWFRYVIEYDLGKQISLIRRLRSAVSDSRRSPTDLLGRYRRPLLATGALLLLVGGIVVYRRRRRRESPDLLKGVGHHSTHPATTVYRKALTLLARNGQIKAPGKTPREFADDLRDRSFSAAAAVDSLTDAYYQARYGRIANPDLKRLISLMAEVKRSLAGEGEPPAS